MYLKSVNINGFKSFSENTNIDFSNKVNVVVGPNGSGKSNVVDAISWVLGTQSPASLRTNKMEDVIFAGTEKLSQKGFAEVNLNFEVDADKFNGTDEISIGDYVLTGGELPAIVLCDSIIRLLPGSMSNSSCALSDSFQDDLLSPPIYTRPSNFKGRA